MKLKLFNNLDKRSIFLVLALVFAVATSCSYIAVAKDGTDDTTSNDNSVITTTSEQSDEPETNSTESETHATTENETEAEVKTVNSLDSTKRTERLEAAKLKICQNRESVMSDTMHRIATRESKRLMFFDQVVEKAKNFYESNGLSSGNYVKLEAEVAKARIAVQSSIQETNALAADFSCEGSDPKGQIERFRTHTNSEIKLMQAYRESIKALVKDIKEAAEQKKDGNQ